MSEKKYQVFISSTYKDLINARKKVMEEVLSMGHFPVGMESFTAGDEEQWEIIESELATTDYYVLILGKRYGSLSPEGIGYTEKEFNHAESLGIPILSFVRDENMAFTDDERETEAKLIKKFNAFRKKIMRGRMIKEWKEINELPGLVSTALNKQITRKPRLGWIRGDQTIPLETILELTRLSKENSQLREELAELKKNAVERTPKLEVEINGVSQLEIQLSKLPFRKPELIEDDYLTEEQKQDKEFLEDLTHELHEDEVFVFSPKGDIYNFPKGSTILDYAFRIHTDVGLHAKGAKISGRMVPLSTELKSGDQIEVITDKKIKPSPIWLRIVRTSAAKQKLRQYFRKIQDETANDVTVSYVAKIPNDPAPQSIEVNTQKKAKPAKKKDKEKREISIVVAGIKDILIRLSSCCSPLPGDDIIGFVTRGRGVSVHKFNCEVAKNHSDRKRLVAVRWDGINNPVPVRIEVKAYDRQGIYLEMVESISRTETNILEAGASSAGEGTLIARFLIEIEHLDQLQEILDNIRSIKNILFAERVVEK